MKFRKLRADEIDCRVATVKGNGLSLLLYKDARCDMNILDETVGALNWTRSHSRENANCTVGVWDESKGCWVSKEDTGTESYTEKEKGLASDSFKRACFNWGIGRELYTAPFIWIGADKCAITLKPDNKNYTCYDRFEVTKIGYDEAGRINLLQIKNAKNNAVVYDFKTAAKQQPKEEANDKAPELVSDPQRATIEQICKAHHIDVGKWIAQLGYSWETLPKAKAGEMLRALKNKYGDD
jgi:hypothetical protein